MGQYYKAVFLDKNGKKPIEHAHPHSCANGLKLMEHSYVDNRFVSAVINEIKRLGGAKLCWAGDYADEERGEELNLYAMAGDTPEINYNTEAPRVRYITNEEKMEYIDLNRVFPCDDELTIHPLPLLTAEGNGRGGGDYSGRDESMVGLWARDKIVVEESTSDEFAETLSKMGYRLLTPRFEH